MPFSRPTLEQINDRIKNDFQSRLTSGSAALRRSVIAAWSRVMAGAIHLLHGHLEWISKQVMPDTAEAEHLERWCSIWGVARRAAEYAEGPVVFTGVNGSVIPEGTELQRSDGAIYLTNEEVEISGGEATVDVTAEEAGSASNAEEAESLTLVSPIAGVTNTATVDAGGIANGLDEEEDEDLRERLLFRIRNPPQGGTEADFEAWALEVSGITRAWIYPQHLGPGTVGVAIVSDGEDPIFPDAAKIEEVQDYIDERRPVTIDTTVFTPDPYEIDFDIELVTDDDSDIRAAIEAELQDLFDREAEPGGTILISHIREAISIAAGETDHILNSPTTNQTAGTGELPVLGDFTWS